MTVKDICMNLGNYVCIKACSSIKNNTGGLLVAMVHYLNDVVEIHSIGERYFIFDENAVYTVELDNFLSISEFRDKRINDILND